MHQKQEKEDEKQEKQKFCNLGDPFETSKSIKKSILHFDYNLWFILVEYPVYSAQNRLGKRGEVWKRQIFRRFQKTGRKTGTKREDDQPT